MAGGHLGPADIPGGGGGEVPRICVWSTEWTSEYDGPHQVQPGGPHPSAAHLRLPHLPLLLGNAVVLPRSL